MRSSPPRIAVIGVGSFGKNHLRIIHESQASGLAKLAGIMEPDPARAANFAAKYSCPIFSSIDELATASDAAVIAAPTPNHADLGCRLMEAGCDVLIEKPIADTLAGAEALIATASRTGRILQIGHLERFNPAILALGKHVTTPLFFEVHRLAEFSPRSLDVDVVLDLMVHDIDIILSMTGTMPEEIRAAGIHILSEKVDIANVRLQFPGGCVANLTASRVSAERVRKLRLFQPNEYISVDYASKEGSRFFIGPEGEDGTATRAIGFEPLLVEDGEPLRLELEEFFHCIATREQPRVTGAAASAALQVALEILEKIEEHSELVKRTLAQG
ncbi:MAG: Gfo/Idh/MocA family oxidoreductase [Acidobacteriota bacterium]